MIAHLFGTITEKLDTNAIIDVNGVGYEVSLPTPDIERYNLNDKVKIYTYHALRENAEELYGFSSLAAKRLFEMLISVNGIGPKAAINILSLGSPEEVRNAIANTDASFISKASGVGKKSAERVIVDLRDKVGAPTKYGSGDVQFISQSSPANDEALDALIALGFPLKEATAALANIDQTLSVEDRIKAALKQR